MSTTLLINNIKTPDLIFQWGEQERRTAALVAGVMVAAASAFSAFYLHSSLSDESNFCFIGYVPAVILASFGLKENEENEPTTEELLQAKMTDIFALKNSSKGKAITHFPTAEDTRRCFTLEECPGYIFKMQISDSLDEQGNPLRESELEKRYMNIKFAQEVISLHNLNLLVIPKVERFYIEIDGVTYTVLKEQFLDVDPSNQEVLFESEEMDTTLDQLITFIYYTGYCDVAIRNMNILRERSSQGHLKIGLPDLEHMDPEHPEYGLYGSASRPGLLDCTAERQWERIISKARKLGLVDRSADNLSPRQRLYHVSIKEMIHSSQERIRKHRTQPI